MRLKRHLILENVSKQEIDDALKNKNIIIGCEFEFIHNDLPEEGVSDFVSTVYEPAYNAWQQYQKEVYTYKKQEELFWKEINKEEKRLEAEVLVIDNIIERQNELDKNSDEWNKLEVGVKKLKKKYDKKAKELEERRDNSYEELDGYWPEIDTDYMQYWEETTGDIPDGISTNSQKGKWFATDAPDDFSIPEPDIVGWGSVPGDDEWQSQVEELNWSSAPFKDYEIGDYGQIVQKLGDTKWAIEADKTLGYQGIEVKSPPTNLPKAIDDIEKMFKYINKQGYTDNRTGFHVHMSVKGINNLEDKLDPVKLLMFMDEGFIWKHFADRVSNIFAMSMKDKFKNEGDIRPNDFSKLVDKKKLKTKMTAEHFDAINLSKWQQGHIEFRYMGGRDYHKKFNEVKAIIGQYSHNISLALDPEFKKKEYLLKIQRIANKMELYKMEKMLEWYRHVSQYTKDLDKSFKNLKLVLKKRMREIENYITSLKKTYKINDREHMLLGNNKGFTYGIEDDIKKDISKIIDKWEDILPVSYMNDIMPFIGMRILKNR